MGGQGPDAQHEATQNGDESSTLLKWLGAAAAETSTQGWAVQAMSGQAQGSSSPKLAALGCEMETEPAQATP